MAWAKKRKISDEGKMFNKEWENSYFFVEISENPVCLVCGKHLAAIKISNLQRHYDSCHGNLPARVLLPRHLIFLPIWITCVELNLRIYQTKRWNRSSKWMLRLFLDRLRVGLVSLDFLAL